MTANPPAAQSELPGAPLQPAPKAGSVVWVCPSYTLVYEKEAGGKSIAACAQNPPMKQLYGAAAGVQILVPASHVPPAWVQAALPAAASAAALSVVISTEAAPWTEPFVKAVSVALVAAARSFVKVSTAVLSAVKFELTSLMQKRSSCASLLAKRARHATKDRVAKA